jgi:hypothetical protein
VLSMWSSCLLERMARNVRCWKSKWPEMRAAGTARYRLRECSLAAVRVARSVCGQKCVLPEMCVAANVRGQKCLVLKVCVARIARAHERALPETRTARSSRFQKCEVGFAPALIEFARALTTSAPGLEGLAPTLAESTPALNKLTPALWSRRLSRTSWRLRWQVGASCC